MGLLVCFVRIQVGTRYDEKVITNMKYYRISFPGECGQHVEEIWSEKQILSSKWYKNWVMMMVEDDKALLINDRSAIGDWTVVHWAVEIPKPNWMTNES